jgi:hypothetical protein
MGKDFGDQQVFALLAVDKKNFYVVGHGTPSLTALSHVNQ